MTIDASYAAASYVGSTSLTGAQAQIYTGQVMAAMPAAAKQVSFQMLGIEDIYMTDNPANSNFPYPTIQTVPGGLVDNIIPNGMKAITTPFGVFSQLDLQTEKWLAAHEGQHWAEKQMVSAVSPLGITWFIAYGVETVARMAINGQSWGHASYDTSFERRGRHAEENFG
ncbi:hypothetical protein JYU04_02265 [Dehalococcoides mccartyi]|nr:hypothetical protein [Dehalococcoides mccartyi]